MAVTVGEQPVSILGRVRLNWALIPAALAALLTSFMARAVIQIDNALDALPCERAVINSDSPTPSGCLAAGRDLVEGLPGAGVVQLTFTTVFAVILLGVAALVAWVQGPRVQWSRVAFGVLFMWAVAGLFVPLFFSESVNAYTWITN